MKLIFPLFIILFAVTATHPQAVGGSADVITTFSENGRFYLKSVPFDNEFPSLKGKTYVYKTGSTTPLYVFERGFDSVDERSNNLILSNDGEVIFFAIPWAANEERDGLKSVTIYKNGQILKSFTETQINGCDKKKERCSLVYSNYEQVVDREKSNFGSQNYRKAFKPGVTEEEKFLSDFAIFSSDDKVYLTDSKKRVHIFDLKDGSHVSADSFANMFAQMKGKARLSKTTLTSYEAPTFLDFPRLKNGRATQQSLARHIGMTAVDDSSARDQQYKWYTVTITSSLFRDGSLEVEAIEADPLLPREKILEFFKSNKFDSSTIPMVFEQWSLEEEYFFFRKKNVQLAKEEKRREKLQQRRDFEKRLTLETIDGVYIPKDLGECFSELDKLLSQVDKEEMQVLPKRDDMIRYHMGLGMWIRNNWGLWSGSRLQKYFSDKGVHHPDEMSGVVLRYYYDWLHGRNESWKDWESNPNSRVQGLTLGEQALCSRRQLLG